MDLASIKTIKSLCKKYNIRPSKKLGQNFLINKSILDKIIKASELSKKDTVLEVGPGFGVLTQELVKYVGKVVAVEKDKRLIKFLKTRIQEYKNIKIINDDILKVETRQCLVSTDVDYKIISNLPYQITSPVLWKFLSASAKATADRHDVGTRRGAFRPSLMVLMMQKEVAERIIAKPGQMSILSVLCQFYTEPKIVAKVSKNNFWPKPEVDSAIIRFTPRQFPRSSAYSSALFRDKEFLKLVKIGFSSKRKMLKNNLSKGLKIPQEKVLKALNKADLDEKIRAQELSINDWIKVLCNL